MTPPKFSHPKVEKATKIIDREMDKLRHSNSREEQRENYKMLNRWTVFQNKATYAPWDPDGEAHFIEFLNSYSDPDSNPAFREIAARLLSEI